MTTTITITINGQRYVALPELTFNQMVERLGDVKLPGLPEPNQRGRRPARETARAILARKLIKHFPREMGYGFTRDMEEKLDEIVKKSIGAILGLDEEDL